MPSRHVIVWTAGHCNGWITRVTEKPDATFSGEAFPPGEAAHLVYREIDEEHTAFEMARTH